MATKTYKPGQKAPFSGQYEEIGPRGGRSGNETTVVRNEPLPPTGEKDRTWLPVDRTKHRSGR